MDNLGFIHERLDLKILILYILGKLSSEVDVNTLYDLCLSDGGVDYFEFSDCLSELNEYGHVIQNASGVIITDKGKRNVEAVSSSLPYSVRLKADEVSAPVNEALIRKSLISASHAVSNGGCAVKLTLSDGVGEILNLSFLCADESHAADIEKKFRMDAETYYSKIVDMFSGDD